jgi:hypothetical protein
MATSDDDPLGSQRPRTQDLAAHPSAQPSPTPTHTTNHSRAALTYPDGNGAFIAAGPTFNTIVPERNSSRTHDTGGNAGPDSARPQNHDSNEYHHKPDSHDYHSTQTERVQTKQPSTIHAAADDHHHAKETSNSIPPTGFERRSGIAADSSTRNSDDS